MRFTWISSILMAAFGFGSNPSAFCQDKTPLTKGKEAMAKGDYREAIELLSKAIVANPRNAEAYFQRGVAYSRLSPQQQKALADYDEALRLNPKLPGAHRERAMCHDLLGHPVKARKDYDEAIRLDPKDDIANGTSRIPNT